MRGGYNCTTWSSPDCLIPTCLFGQCVQNECVCQPGFQHDLVLGRYDNCALPDGVAPALTGVCFVTLSLSMVYGTFVLVRRAAWKSQLWYACATALASSFCFILALIAFAANGFSMPWIGALFTDLGSVLSVHLAGRILMGVLAPVAAAQRIKSTSLDTPERFFLWVLPSFMMLSFVFCLALGYGMETPNGGEVATGMAFVFLTIAVCAIVALPFLYWYPSQLIAALKSSLVSKTNGGAVGGEARTHQIAKLLFKVQVLRFTTCISALGAALVCFLACAFHLEFGTLPFSWMFLFAFVGGLSLFHLQTEHFAKPSSAASSAVTFSSSPRLIPSRASKTPLTPQAAMSGSPIVDTEATTTTTAPADKRGSKMTTFEL